jgi:hypothetical protein
MTNLTSEAIDARCGDWNILDRVILYLSGWADRLADGPTGLAA